jgi:hypothetical protein
LRILPERQLPLENETALERERRHQANDPARFFERNQNAFPSLSRVALIILSIPSSSAEVERSFSKHKLFVSDKRLNLSEEVIRFCRFLQANWRFFNTHNPGI